MAAGDPPILCPCLAGSTDGRTHSPYCRNNGAATRYGEFRTNYHTYAIADDDYPSDDDYQDADDLYLYTKKNLALELAQAREKIAMLEVNRDTYKAKYEALEQQGVRLATVAERRTERRNRALKAARYVLDGFKAGEAEGLRRARLAVSEVPLTPVTREDQIWGQHAYRFRVVR